MDRGIPRGSLALISRGAKAARLLQAAGMAVAASVALAACGNAGSPVDIDADGSGTAAGDGRGFSAGNFRRTLVDSASLNRPYGKALGDIDGDGFPDALLGLYQGSIYWYRYPDWKRFELAQSLGGDDLVAADIDGDGALDAVTNGGSIAWYRNPRGAAGVSGDSLWERHIIHSEMSGHDLVVEDMDGDGRPDVATRKEFGPTTVFFQRDGGDWLQVDLDGADLGTGMAIHDLNGDGHADVVQNGYWLEQPTSPSSSWIRHDIAAWPATSAVGVGDINRDGRPDVVLAVGAENGNIYWFEEPSDPIAGLWISHEVGQADRVHRLHLADLDRDGGQDIVFAEQDGARDPRVGIFLSRQHGAVWDLAVIAREGSHNIALGDVGRDGDLDVLGADWRTDTRLKLWENLAGDY